jgi:[ribosomal protein S5]-alanine N-acetyltransferase
VVTWREGLPEISTGRLIIRIPREGDVPALLKFNEEQQEHFRPWFPVNALTPTREMVLKAVADRRQQAREDRGYRFNLFLQDSPGEVIGLCSIADVRRGAIQQAVLGYGLGHQFQGRGIMTEAVRAAVSFAFEDLDLHRLEGSYMPANEKSAAILESLGFVKEGFFQKYLLLAGEWQDHVVTSLVNPNWKGTGPRIQE